MLQDWLGRLEVALPTGENRCQTEKLHADALAYRPTLLSDPPQGGPWFGASLGAVGGALIALPALSMLSERAPGDVRQESFTHPSLLDLAALIGELAFRSYDRPATPAAFNPVPRRETDCGPQVSGCRCGCAFTY